MAMLKNQMVYPKLVILMGKNKAKPLGLRVLYFQTKLHIIFHQELERWGFVEILDFDFDHQERWDHA